jgi:hypothetical protein
MSVVCTLRSHCTGLGKLWQLKGCPQAKPRLLPCQPGHCEAAVGCGPWLRSLMGHLRAPCTRFDRFRPTFATKGGFWGRNCHPKPLRLNTAVRWGSTRGPAQPKDQSDTTVDSHGAAWPDERLPVLLCGLAGFAHHKQTPSSAPMFPPSHSLLRCYKLCLYRSELGKLRNRAPSAQASRASISVPPLAVRILAWAAARRKCH